MSGKFKYYRQPPLGRVRLRGRGGAVVTFTWRGVRPGRHAKPVLVTFAGSQLYEETGWRLFTGPDLGRIARFLAMAGGSELPVPVVLDLPRPGLRIQVIGSTSRGLSLQVVALDEGGAEESDITFDTSRVEVQFAARRFADDPTLTPFDNGGETLCTPISQATSTLAAPGPLLWKAIHLPEGSRVDHIQARPPRVPPTGHAAILWVWIVNPDCDPQIALERLAATIPGTVGQIRGTLPDGWGFAALIAQASAADDQQWADYRDVVWPERPPAHDDAHECPPRVYVPVTSLVDADDTQIEALAYSMHEQMVRTLWECYPDDEDLVAEREAYEALDRDEWYDGHLLEQGEEAELEVEETCYAGHMIIEPDLINEHIDWTEGYFSQESWQLLAAPGGFTLALQGLLAEVAGASLADVITAQGCLYPGEQHHCQGDPVRDALARWRSGLKNAGDDAR